MERHFVEDNTPARWAVEQVRRTTLAVLRVSALVVAMAVAAVSAATAQPLTVSHLAGTLGGGGTTDGTGPTARFAQPSGVAVDTAGTIYVADTDNHTIRKVTLGGVVTTLAGLAGVSGSADGTGIAARFYHPSGVAVDGAGTVYVADERNHTIRRVAPGGMVTTLAGRAGFIGSTDGAGSAARFSFPRGVAVAGAGTVYVADSSNHTIRTVTAAGVVTTLAGLAGVNGSADGTGSAARFNQPHGVAVDAAGTVYVGDKINHTIRKVTAGGLVTTLAGLAGSEGSADGGAPWRASSIPLAWRWTAPARSTWPIWATTPSAG
jgi:sugar lactone lactonase YvrE